MVQYLEQSFCAKELKTWTRLEAIRSGSFFGRDAVNQGNAVGYLFRRHCFPAHGPERIEGIKMCEQWVCGESKHEPCRSVIECCCATVNTVAPLRVSVALCGE